MEDGFDDNERQSHYMQRIEGGVLHSIGRQPPQIYEHLFLAKDPILRGAMIHKSSAQVSTSSQKTDSNYCTYDLVLSHNEDEKIRIFHFGNTA